MNQIKELFQKNNVSVSHRIDDVKDRFTVVSDVTIGVVEQKSYWEINKNRAIKEVAFMNLQRRLSKQAEISTDEYLISRQEFNIWRSLSKKFELWY